MSSSTTFFACLLPVLLALGAVACSSAPAGDESSGSDTAAIQGGVEDLDDPAVGLSRTSSGYCTATLIAPDVVLTAGHCVRSTVAGFYTSDGTTSPTVFHAVKSQAAFPGYVATGCPSSTLDIGLLRLATPITNIAPKHFGAAPAAGTSCVAVGYGRHTVSGVIEREKKRSATEIIDRVDQSTILVEAGTGIADHGDSGGPLLCGDVIVGTVSCHTDGDIPSHKHEYYAHVSEAASWITSQVELWDGVPASDAGAPASDAGTVHL